MLRILFLSTAMALTVCSSVNAADVRRVVTGLDANNKAVALFDGRLTLSPGKSGIPAANLWMTETLPPGFSFNSDMAKPTGLNPPTTAR